MIRFISRDNEADIFDISAYYKVKKRSAPDGGVPLAIATTFEEAYDACTILLELKREEYSILPPTKS